MRFSLIKATRKLWRLTGCFSLEIKLFTIALFKVAGRLA